MAVPFTLVDLKFLVKQSFSLTLQPPRPTLSKVNKTYEQYRHYNAFVIVLLVRKISKMKLLLSCSSGRQDLRGDRKIPPARGTAGIFSPLCPIFMIGCFTFHLFCTPNQSYTHFFKNTFTFIYFYLVMYLQLAGSVRAYKILLARGIACIFSRLCTIFITVCSTFYFSALQISLTLSRITFYKSIITFFFLIWPFTSSWQDLNPLTPMSDLDIISPYNINTISIQYQYNINTISIQYQLDK